MTETELKHSDNEGRLLQLLKSFNQALSTSYSPFEYQGPESPDSVLVVFGTMEATLAPVVANVLSDKGISVGIVNVRVYRPFVEEAFLEVLPASVTTVGVLGQVGDEIAVVDTAQHSLLYRDVLATVNFASSSVSVVDIKYCRSEVLTAEMMLEKFRQLDQAVDATSASNFGFDDAEAQTYRFWDIDDSPSNTAPVALGKLLSAHASRHIRVSTGYDNLVQGGVVRTEIEASTSTVSSYANKLANITIVGNERLIGEFDVLNTVENASTLLIKLPGAKDDDLEKRLSVGLRKGIATKQLHFYVLDPSVSTKVSEDVTPGVITHTTCFSAVDWG